MNKYVYYKIPIKDEELFDKKMKSSKILYRKIYVPELILCEEQAEEKLGCDIFGTYNNKDDDIQNISDIKEKIIDLRDVMYMYISSSKDYRNTVDKTFEQIYKIWRNTNDKL